MDAPPTVATGALVAYRLFDVAYAIDLKRVESLWRSRAGGVSTRRTLSSTPAKAVAFGVPPVSLALDPVTIWLDGVETAAMLSARLYDFGVVTLALRAPLADVPWAAFVAGMNAFDAAVGAGAENAVWDSQMARLRGLVGEAFDRPSAAMLQEDYLAGVVTAFDAPMTAAELMQRVDLVPPLSGEHRKLSDGARQDLLRKRFSYYDDDLVVLTWDRAFIYEPRGETDVIDVLEVANAQLLEMRYYDELLDAELPRMYELVQTARRTRSLLSSRRFADLARRFHTLVAEVTELAERVDNALQVTEDVYLARIYATALDLFRVDQVNAAVNRKLAIIRDTYTALYDEAQGARSELLEILIVLLIVGEILLALFRR